MLISAIIITACFIGVVILIITNKLNRAFAALAGAIITYFTLTFIEKQDFFSFIGYLFGTSTDNYVNLRSLVLIMGMLFIVQVCHSGGVFQFIGFKLIQISRGKPFYLLLVMCGLALLISAVLNNILAVIVLIPLTIVASLMLGINPTPYIIAEAIMVNVGGILFSISSIPNILITTAAGITFVDFFLNVGLLSFLLFAITLAYFHLYYRNKLMIPKERMAEVLRDFNVWNYVPNRALFYKASIVLIAVLVCFAAIPSNIISPDMIAITGAVSLVIISKLNGREVIQKIDLELILYLLGIFVITGAMDTLGVINLVGNGLIAITGSNSFGVVIIILWTSAFLSSSIDNVPITKVLIPMVNDMTTGFTHSQINGAYYSLTFGANLGDNLTPLGDNILVMNLAEQNDRPLSFSEFFRLGFTATIIQLCTITIYFVFLNDTILGLSILSLIGLGFFLLIFIRYLKQNVKKEEELILFQTIDKIKRQKLTKNKKLVIFRTIYTIRSIMKKLLGIKRD